MNFLLKAEVQKLQALANEQVDLYCFLSIYCRISVCLLIFICIAASNFTHVGSK